MPKFDSEHSGHERGRTPQLPGRAARPAVGGTTAPSGGCRAPAAPPPRAAPLPPTALSGRTPAAPPLARGELPRGQKRRRKARPAVFQPERWGEKRNDKREPTAPALPRRRFPGCSAAACPNPAAPTQGAGTICSHRRAAPSRSRRRESSGCTGCKRSRQCRLWWLPFAPTSTAASRQPFHPAATLHFWARSAHRSRANFLRGYVAITSAFSGFSPPSYAPTPIPTPGNSARARYSQFVAVNPRCQKPASSRATAPRAGESIFSPAGGSQQPPACLPRSRSPSTSQSLCAPFFSAHLLHAASRHSGCRGSRETLLGGPGRGGAVPNSGGSARAERSARLPPRQCTSRAAAGSGTGRWAPPYRRELHSTSSQPPGSHSSSPSREDPYCNLHALLISIRVTE